MLASTPSDLPFVCVARPATGCHTNRRPRPARSRPLRRILGQVDRQGAPDRGARTGCAARPNRLDCNLPTCAVRSVSPSGGGARSQTAASRRPHQVGVLAWVGRMSSSTAGPRTRPPQATAWRSAAVDPSASPGSASAGAGGWRKSGFGACRPSAAKLDRPQTVSTRRWSVC